MWLRRRHKACQKAVQSLAVVLMAAPAVAAEPVVLQGPEIISTFDGKTVSGAYADGLAVRETYQVGGGISYWDPRGSSVGKWFVVNNQLCTFYEGMPGGCFRVEKLGANCYDYYAVANSAEEALNPLEKPRYTARGAIEGAASTCPEELQV